LLEQHAAVKTMTSLSVLQSVKNIETSRAAICQEFLTRWTTYV